MAENNFFLEPNEVICENCQAKINFKYDICPHCDFPFQGSEEEKNRFRGRQILLRGELEEGKGKIKQARYILFGIGGLYVIFSLIFFNSGFTGAILAGEINLVLAFVYLFLGYSIHKNPIFMLSIGLGIQVLLHAMNAIRDPQTIVQGLVFKAIVLISLGTGLYWAIQSRKILKKHKL